MLQISQGMFFNVNRISNFKRMMWSSKEPSHRDGSFEFQQRTFRFKKEKDK